jgi:hypothetical protein
MILCFVMGTSKKIQRKGREKGQQALHQFFKAVPKALDVYFRLANSLPIETKDDFLFLQVSIEGFIALPDKPANAEVIDDIINESYEEWMNYINSLPQEIANLYLPLEFEALKPVDIKMRFEFLVWTHGRVDYFKQLTTALRELTKFKEGDLTFNIFFPRDTYIHIDNQGVMNVRTPAFLQALDGVEINRIRECPVCSSIFWAGRITQQCCTPRCSNIFRVRRHRFRSDEEKGELKLKRIKREENKPRGKDK